MCHDGCAYTLTAHPLCCRFENVTCAVPGSRFNDSHWSNTAGATGQRAGHGRPVGPGLAASAKQADMRCATQRCCLLSTLHGALDGILSCLQSVSH